jgi:hypothetical protein
MKRGGKGTGAGAATAVLLLALLVLAASQADGAAVARRLGELKPNGCTSNPNNPGAPCQSHSPSKQAAARADESPVTGFQPNP